MDSTVLLYLALASRLDVSTISYQRFGRPGAESDCAEAIVRSLAVRRYAVEYPGVRCDSEETVYALTETNLSYYCTASDLASRIGARAVLGGQIREDYLDHSGQNADPDYYELLGAVLRRELGERTPELVLPFLGLAKHEVVRLGMGLSVPFERTWSCNADGERPCGECSQCRERRNAFTRNGLLEVP